MKELLMVRHGKSSWDYDVDDKDRPLLERGVRDGHRVARALSGSLPLPDRVFSSHANRALHTCIIVMRDMGIPMDRLQVTPELYDFSGSAAMGFVQGLDDRYNRVMIFGHNPTFTHIANSWGSQYIDNVPTTGFVHLRFDIDTWSRAEGGETLRTVFPKHLR